MSAYQPFWTGSERRPRLSPPGGIPGAQPISPLPRLCQVIFLALVLPLGIILAFITPFGGVADETAHALRAESLSHGEILGYRAMIQLPDGSQRQAAGVSADLGLEDAAMADGPGQWVTGDVIRDTRAAQWHGTRSFAEITPLALYMPVFYVPAAVAMAATRLLHGSPADAYLAGRLVNLLVFAGLGILALSVARRGHAVLLCVFALPMEVSLAASLNQDGLLVATAALAMAFLTRAEEEAALTPQGRWVPSFAWLLSGLLLGLVALAKMPYAGLLLTLVFPIKWRRDCALRLAGAALFAVPALVWTAYAMHAIATPWPPLPRYQAGPLWPGPSRPFFTSPNAAAQLHVLGADPLRILTLTLRSLWAKKAILLEFIGILGFLSVRLPYPLYALWALALATAMIADRRARDMRPVPARDQAALALMLALIVIAIYMSQYLSWTPVGFPIVLGPTGRYFLPLLPATMFLLPRFGRPTGSHPSLLLVPLAAAVVASLVVTPLCVLDGFYAP
jgi:hypothetical protein